MKLIKDINGNIYICSHIFASDDLKSIYKSVCLTNLNYQEHLYYDSDYYSYINSCDIKIDNDKFIYDDGSFNSYGYKYLYININSDSYFFINLDTKLAGYIPDNTYHILPEDIFNDKYIGHIIQLKFKN